MKEVLKIPEERRPVLIGKDGKTKERLESETGTRISVNEDVEIEGETENVLKAKEIVQAIGRGFSPEDAFDLIQEDYQLYIVDLGGESRNTIKRLLGRVIGRKGATKRIIEQTTDTKISIYGKTVSIIGDSSGVRKAADVIEDLLAGRSHSFAYRRLREQ